jgi:hypothetical protein
MSTLVTRTARVELHRAEERLDQDKYRCMVMEKRLIA